MKRKFEKLGVASLFQLFSFLGIFIKNQKITRKKLIYGALIVGFATSVSGYNRHQHTCYSVRYLDNVETNDSTKTNAVIKND